MEEALRHLNAAAEHGHQKAVGALGWHHLLNENYELAFKYLQMGAEKGQLVEASLLYPFFVLAGILLKCGQPKNFQSVHEIKLFYSD